ncbi:MAG: hypothetical protein R3C05_17240 [Pirellulaceae bacterium]
MRGWLEADESFTIWLLVHYWWNRWLAFGDRIRFVSISFLSVHSFSRSRLNSLSDPIGSPPLGDERLEDRRATLRESIRARRRTTADASSVSIVNRGC